jgi:hypothetical protein
VRVTAHAMNSSIASADPAEPEAGKHTTLLERTSRLWALPLAAVLLYPAFIISAAHALDSFHHGGSPIAALGAFVTLLLAAAVPALALRALLLLRRNDGRALIRGALYVMFATAPLFSLMYSLARLVHFDQNYAAFSAAWVGTWVAVGFVLYLHKEREAPITNGRSLTALRTVHGVTALCILCGFLVAHLVNHDLALWSVKLHGTVMKFLRLWYRSQWVEPALLAALVVMICTGVSMVARYSRRRADGYRVLQMSTGVFVGVFLCSHVMATLIGRHHGLETDWSFAAGPTSLLDGVGIRDRLIPHYVFAVFFLTLHVGCGVRIVLLHHGVTPVFANRMVYGFAIVGLIVTALASAALLGFHVIPA